MVEENLIKSLKNGLNLAIYIMETRPLDLGIKLYNKLIPYTNNIYLVPDISLSVIMERIDFVLLGA